MLCRIIPRMGTINKICMVLSSLKRSKFILDCVAQKAAITPIAHQESIWSEVLRLLRMSLNTEIWKQIKISY